MTSIAVSSYLNISQTGDDVWHYELGGSGDTGDINAFPVLILNMSSSDTIPVNVYFTSDITIRNLNQYFDLFNDGIAFYGQRNKIIVDNVSNYPGLVKNGSSTENGKSRVYVEYIGITCINGSTLATGAGWLAQEYFGKSSTYNYVTDCWSDGDISAGGSGGIVGSSINPSDLSIIRCYSLGSIGTGSGGICGSTTGGLIIISECYSTGIIGTDAGGILAKDSSGTVTIQKCYSRGVIGTNAGGIVGSNSGEVIAVNNCYSSGQIGVNAGGIFSTGSFIVSRAMNCYTCGFGTDPTSGGIYDNNSNDNITATNNYSERNNGNSGNWSRINATNSLTGTPNSGSLYGSIWCCPIINAQFEIKTIGLSPYTSEITNNYSETILQGGQSSPSLLPSGYTYAILAVLNPVNDTEIPIPSGININASTGVISVGSSVPIGNYLLIIRDFINPYNISELELNVSLVCYGPGTKVLVGEPISTNNIGSSQAKQQQQTINEKYIDITELRPGMLVKTYRNGYLPIAKVGEKTIRTGTKPHTTLFHIPTYDGHPSNSELTVTGGHSILMPNDILKQVPIAMHQQFKYYNRRMLISGCPRILAMNWPGAIPVPAGTITKIYHIVLDGPLTNYGIWVNGGWLSETIEMKLFQQFGFREFCVPCQNA